MPDTPTRDTVYFYKFNNYYNRIIKKYDTIADYGDPLATQTDCNFVHGDGINTSFTLNKGTTLLDTPDYVLVLDYNNNISRWFVINSFKSRNGQDLLTLRRDLVADFFDDVLKRSPSLIRKGYVDNTSPFIFNNEGVQYNKIKREEVLIKDESNCSYIVGFFANNAFPSGATVNGTIKDDNYAYSFTDLASFPYSDYVEGAGNSHTQEAKICRNNSVNTRTFYALKNSGRRVISASQTWNAEMFFNKSNFSLPTGTSPLYATSFNGKIYYNTDAMSNNVRLKSDANVDGAGGFTADRNQAFTNYYSIMSSNMNYDDATLTLSVETIFGLQKSLYDALNAYNGKKIKLGSTVYDCEIVITSPVLETKTSALNPNIAWNSVLEKINSYIPTSLQLSNSVGSLRELDYVSSSNKQYTVDDIRLLLQTQQVYLQFSEAATDISTTVDTPSNRTHLSEQPYDMFVLINESNIPYKIGTTDYVSNHEININMAQAICEAAGGAAYDVQIVPFNPIRGAILADGTINWLNYDSHAIKDANNNVVGHYILCSSADLKFTLEKDELKFNPSDYKLDYNTRQYRLCSPNQETIFDFSPSVNGGIDTWEVTANYRPFASYIKIQPTWKSWYGEATYNGSTDFRGLVYNSSLCVTQLNDAWSNYVSNNKNFQQLFDNQINTLTKQQSIELNAMEETLGWRSYTGMPISSIARVIGGSKDIEMQRELNNVALSKLNTDFKYQLDNIQSMPHTIKKLTNINGDTRVFPYIEIYGCSEDEEKSFNLKMKYTGYTIMTTGYCWDYLKVGEETFIQADLIRLDLSFSEETADNHMAVEIAAELDKGLYITKESE